MIAENLALLRKSIPIDKVTVIAVTKTQPPEVVREAYASGLTIVGENRVQEAMEKAASLKDLPLEWHLIGHLQTNKVKQAVSLFSLIHSVDSSKLAVEIDRCAKSAGKIQNVLLQINVAGEDTKSGVAVAQVDELAALIESLDYLRLCGVMTIAPFYEDQEQTRPIFREMRSIFESIKRKVSHPESFRWLSMGMTHDFKVAVEEGANMVRIGTGLFGVRTVR
ncbi:MAG: YggS family pyridoxal phosphate-dependent enzyme [Negativicutes bacterium]